MTLLAGLGGALIGATAAIAGQVISVRQQRLSDRRREQVELVARLWGAADRLWRHTQGLDSTLALMTVQTQTPEIAETNQQEWRDASAARLAADTETQFCLAQLRLLYPQVAKSANMLWEASRQFDQHHASGQAHLGEAHRSEMRAARQTALEAYENDARRLLAT